jgi:hypothetical protein
MTDDLFSSHPVTVYACQHNYAGDIHPPVPTSASLQCPCRGETPTNTIRINYAEQVKGMTIRGLFYKQVQNHAFTEAVFNSGTCYYCSTPFSSFSCRRTEDNSNRLLWRHLQNTQTTHTSTPSEAKVGLLTPPCAYIC